MKKWRIQARVRQNRPIGFVVKEVNTPSKPRIDSYILAALSDLGVDVTVECVESDADVSGSGGSDG